MARCARCDKFMLFSAGSGLCKQCEANAVQEKRDQSGIGKSDERQRIEAINKRANDALRSNFGSYANLHTFLWQCLDTEGISYDYLKDSVRSSLKEVGISDEEIALFDYDDFFKKFFENIRSRDSSPVVQENIAWMMESIRMNRSN